jgi:omega-6 fatty acid desaturase (delta-12 desaturase)
VSATHRLKQQKRAIIERHAKADNLIAWTQVATTLGPMGLLWWAAAQLSDFSYWAAIALTLPLSLFTLRVLVLMHECGHGSLFGARWLNRTLGFVLGVVAGMPQYVWSQHHDFHHSHNGNWEKYRGPLTTPSVDEFDAMTAAQRKMYERTRSIAIAPLGGFVYLLFNPRFTWLKGSIELLIHVVKRKSANPEMSWRAHAETFRTRYWKSRTEYWHMFWNNLVLMGCWILMSAALGAALFFPIYLLSVSLAGGAGIMLFTVQHNFEHAYASDSKSWDYDVGAMQGTSFLQLPGWLNWFTASIAYHHVHHLSAKIPNYRLAACHEENLELFADVTRVKMRDIPHALKCLLWDSRAQRIISFAEYRAQRSSS